MRQDACLCTSEAPQRSSKTMRVEGFYSLKEGEEYRFPGKWYASKPYRVMLGQFGLNTHLINHPLIIRGTMVYLAFQDLIQFFRRIPDNRNRSDMSAVRDKFDFEVGQLVKSPCVTCKIKNHFPACSDGCETLDRIRGILAKGISSTYSAFDPTPSS